MFQIKDVLLLPTMGRAKLIAGNGGLGNRVRWSYKAETMEFEEWVHGQELLIVSSAVISRENFNMEQLVKEAIRLHLSGVLLLVGDSYIQSITQRTRNLADRYNLPLIGLPADVPLVDVFEELGHAIAYQDRDRYKNGDLLAGIIFAASVNKEMLEYQAKMIGYPLNQNQRIFMLHMSFENPADAMLHMEDSQLLMEDIFEKRSCPLVVSCFSNNLVGMTGVEDPAILEKLLSEFQDITKSKGFANSCQIGVGGICCEVKRLKDSFREASRCLSLSEQSWSDWGTIWFEKLGFARVLLSMSNPEILLQYMEQVLGPVVEYDLTSEGKLLETLQAWFDCDENMKLAANAIFTHPNTIKYRLQKIEELTGYHLSNSWDKLELLNALMIRNYLATDGDTDTDGDVPFL